MPQVSVPFTVSERRALTTQYLTMALYTLLVLYLIYSLLGKVFISLEDFTSQSEYLSSLKTFWPAFRQLRLLYSIPLLVSLWEVAMFKLRWTIWTWHKALAKHLLSNSQTIKAIQEPRHTRRELQCKTPRFEFGLALFGGV